MGTNAALILQLLLIASEQAQKWAQLVVTANAEGRDVTDEELNQASSDYEKAKADLDAYLVRG
jgi:hypothetical protein